MQKKDEAITEIKEKGDFDKTEVKIDEIEDTKNNPPTSKTTRRGSKTPPRRNRSNSTKSVEEAVIPEPSEDLLETPTPSRRKARSPSNESIPRRMTRRSSREVSEPKEETISTPSRRTRSRAKSINDNESVASDVSLASNDSDERVVKRGRKPLLARIPEAEEAATSKKGDVEDIITEYSQARR